MKKIEVTATKSILNQLMRNKCGNYIAFHWFLLRELVKTLSQKRKCHLLREYWKTGSCYEQYTSTCGGSNDLFHNIMVQTMNCTLLNTNVWNINIFHWRWKRIFSTWLQLAWFSSVSTHTGQCRQIISLLRFLTINKICWKPHFRFQLKSATLRKMYCGRI